MLVSKRNSQPKEISNFRTCFNFFSFHKAPPPPRSIIFPSYITRSSIFLRIRHIRRFHSIHFLISPAILAPHSLLRHEPLYTHQRELTRLRWLSHPFLVDPYLQPVCRGKSCQLGLSIIIFWVSRWAWLWRLIKVARH